MKIKYTIDENDFLTHQLFLTSKSPKINKTRKITKFKVPIYLIIISILLSALTQTLDLLVICAIFIVLYLIFFLKWERNYYKKYYLEYIRENFSNLFDKTITLEITNDFFFSQEKGYENKIMTSELKEITEIPSLILIKLSNGQSIILPKNQITEIEILKLELQKLSAYLNINYNIETNWKWK